MVPLKLYSLEGRYATALYTAAVKANNLTTVEPEILKIRKVLEKSNELLQFMNDPSHSSQAKKSQITATLTSNNYSPLVINFFNVIADYGRFGIVLRILNNFEEIMKAHRNEISMTVTSAKELDSSVIKRLTETISKKFVEKSQTLKVSTKVDPNLIGGLIVEVGDKTIDLSVSSKINKINKLISEPI